MNEELADREKCVVGIRQVIRLAKQGELAKIYIAEDADKELIDSVKKCAEETGIRLERIRTRKKLGAGCGISVGAACAGIHK